MCFGGSKSTNNVNSPAYPATYEAGAGAVQRDSTTERANPGNTIGGGLAPRPTQYEATTGQRMSAGAGLNVRGM